VQETKQEMAALQGAKGKDMMMNSSAAEKMKDDPRFKAAMGLNWLWTITDTRLEQINTHETQLKYTNTD